MDAGINDNAKAKFALCIKRSKSSHWTIGNVMTYNCLWRHYLHYCFSFAFPIYGTLRKNSWHYVPKKTQVVVRPLNKFQLFFPFIIFYLLILFISSIWRWGCIEAKPQIFKGTKLKNKTTVCAENSSHWSIAEGDQSIKF